MGQNNENMVLFAGAKILNKKILGNLNSIIFIINMVKKKRSKPRDLAEAEWKPTTRSGKPLASETPEVMHTPGLHKKKKRPLSGK